MSTDDLELRVAWQAHVGRSAIADAWFETTIQCHRQADRHYHGVRHVRWVVRQVLAIAAELAADRIDDLSVVVAAACFHDAVYDPRSPTNEADSAALARRALGEIGWPDDRVDRVVALVLATAGHDTAGHATATGMEPRRRPLDTAVLLAADLSVLASEPGSYGDYVRGIRREYAHVDDLSWRSGRSAVLHGFLDRTHVFDPELGLGSWEARARANMEAELAMWRD